MKSSSGPVSYTHLDVYKRQILPDVEIQWNSVWIGAIVTAFLFTIGKFLIGIYFEIAKPTSVFGAAGTIILLMMWINYSCQLVFFGAEFTKVYAIKKGYSCLLYTSRCV